MNKSVLVIESNTLLLKKLREILSKEGFEVITVTNFELAVYLCNKINFEYILAKPELLGIINNKLQIKEGKDVDKSN